jgi:hypothetical protein
MDSPLVGVLTSRCVLEERKQEVLSKRGVQVEPCRPRREDNVNSVHVAVARYFCRGSLGGSDRRGETWHTLHKHENVTRVESTI